LLKTTLSMIGLYEEPLAEIVLIIKRSKPVPDVVLRANLLPKGEI